MRRGRTDRPGRVADERNALLSVAPLTLNCGQAEGEGGAPAGFALNRDGAAVRFGAGADEAEAEPQSGRGAALLRAVQTVPDARQIAGSGARALILNGERNRSVGAAAGQRHGTSVRAVFERRDPVVAQFINGQGLGIHAAGKIAGIGICFEFKSAGGG